VPDEIFSRTDADIGASSNHFEAVAMLSNGWSTENITASSPSSRNAQRSGESENIPAVVIATLLRIISAGFQSLTSPLNAFARASRRQSRYGRVSPIWPSKNFNLG
jgi:hypothetical protein